MRGARQLRSTDLGLILPSGTSQQAHQKQSANNNDAAEYADILGGDEGKNAYSSEVVDRNIVLQSEVVEYEQLLETTAEVQLEGVRSQREILVSRNQKGLECLERFDCDYRCPTSSHMNKDRLIELLELDVHVGTLLKNLKVARKLSKVKIELSSNNTAATNAQPPPAAQPITNDEGGEPAALLSVTPRTNHDQASAVSSARSFGSGISALPAEVGHSVTKVEELLSDLHQRIASAEVQQRMREELVSITQAYFGNSGVQLGNAVIQLNAMAFTDVMQFIKTKVSGTNELFDQKKSQAESAKELHVAAATTEPIDVAVFETTLKEYIDAVEAAMKINADRLNQLMMNSDSEGNFRSSYETCSELIHTTIVEQRQERTELLKEIQTDLTKMEAEGTRRFKEAEAAQQQYEQWREESIANITTCSEKQKALWDQVEGLVAQIAEIGRERAAHVKEHQETTEKEYQRRRYHDEFTLTHRNHTAHLTTLRDLSTYTLKMLDQIELFYEHMTTAVDAKNFEEGLHDMKLSDQKKFVELYHAFVIQNTELLGRRNARRLLANRTARVSESLIAADPMAVDKDVHKASLQSNLSLSEQLREECERIAERVEKWEPLFEAVMEQLDADNIHFEDPRATYAEVWNTRINEIRSAADQTISDEMAVLSEKEMEVNALYEKAALHRTAFDDMRVRSPDRKKLKPAKKNLSSRTPRSPRMM